MIVSINQPAYLPWLGYFDRIAKSDLHIVLDHVQFEKNSMINRNKLRTSQGWSWLTVPISSSGKFGDLEINQLRIAKDSRWQKKHWNSILANYSKAPYFQQHKPFFEAIFSENWENLDSLLSKVNGYLMQVLGITTKILKSSEMNPAASKSELILELCIKSGANTYLSGPQGRNYLELNQFKANGITVQFQEYKHPEYRQLHGDFLPFMSVIDLLFNEGPSSFNVLTGVLP